MPQDQYISVEGYNIRYWDTGGEGKVILLTHGIGGSLEVWQDTYELLAKDDKLRVICWDLPGHGLSDFGHQPYAVEDFTKTGWHFLDALNIDQPVYIIGNSMGGAISVHMTDLQPDRVSKLCLIGSASLGKKSPLPFRLMSLPLLGELLNRPDMRNVENHIKVLFHDAEKHRPKIEAVTIRDTMRPGTTKAFLSTLRLMTNLSGQRPELYQKTLSMLKNVKMPVLFIHGADDVVIDLEHSQHAQSLTPNSSLLVFEQCGHTPQMEFPEKTVDALLDFIYNA